MRDVSTVASYLPIAHRRVHRHLDVMVHQPRQDDMRRRTTTRHTETTRQQRQRPTTRHETTPMQAPETGERRTVSSQRSNSCARNSSPQHLVVEAARNNTPTLNTWRWKARNAPALNTWRWKARNAPALINQSSNTRGKREGTTPRPSTLGGGSGRRNRTLHPSTLGGGRCNRTLQPSTLGGESGKEQHSNPHRALTCPARSLRAMAAARLGSLHCRYADQKNAQICESRRELARERERERERRVCVC